MTMIFTDDPALLKLRLRPAVPETFFAYLRDILGRLPTQPVDRLDELLPDIWFTSHLSARRKTAA